MKHLFLTGLTP